MRGISKSFPGVMALRAVDLTVRGGEIHGLVGENGAGKSTLIKILAGAYTRDAGEVAIGGERVLRADPEEMIRRGVAVIYQEPALAPHLSTAENIFLGRLPTTRGLIDYGRLARDTVELSERLGLDLQPHVPVRMLSVARRQMVEIAKALSRDARVIVLDEPSAVLGDSELRGLFAVMRRLAARGVAFVYISHRLAEVFEITDRVTVLKDGAVVATGPTRELTADALVRLMVGRGVSTERVRQAAPRADAPALAVRDLGRKGVLHGITFDVRPGEILGIAGLAGAGRTELLRCLHGAEPADTGTIEVYGKQVRITSPRAAIALGIGLLTEDRKADGLLLAQSVAVNTTIVRPVARYGVLRGAAERALVGAFARRLAIRMPGVHAPVAGLSGGNQQKVMFARWLHAECRILLVDEPTRGVDVGAKREIWRLLAELAGREVAVVMVSSELPEILAVSDRVAVLREGRLTALLDRASASEERIMALASP